MKHSKIVSKKYNKKFNHNKTVKNNICSPIVKNKTIFEKTCLTLDAIQEIKNEYNKHANITINTNNPHKIWEILNERFTKCNNDLTNKDICWLNQLKNKNISNKIKQHIFVPKSPFTWIKNSNEWLSNYEIDSVLVQYEKAYPYFKAIKSTPIDFDTTINCICVSNELCNFNLSLFLKHKITKIGFVFNLDKHTGKGTHWVSMFVDILNKFIFYFDSNGSIIPSEIVVLKNRIVKQGNFHNIHFRFYNNVNIQHQQGNTECGMYSLFFIITMLTSNIKNKHLSLQQKINFFRKNKIPDKYVETYRQIFFRNYD